MDMRRRTLTEEHKAKLSAALKGRAPSAEHRAKLSAALKGRALSHGHGRPQTPTYRTWHAMVNRCTNPKHSYWKDYGGRQPNPVTIEDPRWRSFVNFLADMGECPEGTTIDRKDNERGYFKDNCRWSTSQEQRANRRER